MYTSNVQDNEILKAVDLNDCFDAQIVNIANALTSIFETKKDFVISEKEIVTANSDEENDFSLNIAPIFAISSYDGTPICEPSINRRIVSLESPSDYDRIDTVQIKGEYEKYDIQQRAFFDFDTENKTVENVFTKKRLVLKVQILRNSIHSLTAPEKTEGWIKIAEIVVPANARRMSDCTINNISSDVSTMENDNWTNEKNISYNIQHISDVNERFRQEHKNDGSHADRIIHFNNIDIGTGSNQLHGNNVPAGKEVLIKGNSSIVGEDTIAESLKKLADAFNTIYDTYKANGDFFFNREITIAGDNTTTYSGNRLKIGFSEDGSAYIKLGDKPILTIQPNGVLNGRTDYAPTEKGDLVNKKITDDISDRISAMDSRVINLENTNDKTVYTNDVLSRYKPDNLSITVATTINISLEKPQSIDGISCKAGDIVLVKDQNNSKENGIYKITDSDWVRLTNYDAPNKLMNKLFSIKNGTNNAGKMFYIAKVNFINGSSFGSDAIDFSEYFGSINPLKDKIPVRDAGGCVKTESSKEGNDCVNRNDILSGDVKMAILNYTWPVGSIYWSSNPTSPETLFGGKWKAITDKFIYAAGSKPVNSTGGSENATLTDINLPSHNHGFAHSHTGIADMDINVKFPKKTYNTTETDVLVDINSNDNAYTQYTEFNRSTPITLSGTTDSTDLFCRLNTGMDSADIGGSVTFIPMNWDTNYIAGTTGDISVDQNGTSIDKGFDRYDLVNQRIRRRINFNFSHSHTNPSYVISTDSGSDRSPSHKHSISLTTSSATGKHRHQLIFSKRTGSHKHKIVIDEQACNVTKTNKMCQTTTQNREVTDSTGTSTPFSVMNPYEVKYCWERTE